MPDTIADLRRIALFHALAPPALDRVTRVAIRRTYAPDEHIVYAGDPCEAAYFIAAGEVRVYRLSPQGREQVLTQLGPGHAFNLAPLFQDARASSASAVALTEVTLYALLKDDLLRLIAECPEMALALLRDFAGRLTHLTGLVEDLALRTVRARLARFLLEQGDAQHVARGWTQDEIAAQIGTVRDVVGRTLRAFADTGLIEVGRGRIALLDRPGLEAEIAG